MVPCTITSINPVPNQDGTIAVTVTRTDNGATALLGVQPGVDAVATDANIQAEVEAYANSLTVMTIPTNLIGSTVE